MQEAAAYHKAKQTEKGSDNQTYLSQVTAEEAA